MKIREGEREKVAMIRERRKERYWEMIGKKKRKTRIIIIDEQK